METETITNVAIRPKFELYIDHLNIREVIKRISVALEKENAPVKGTVIDSHIILRIPLDKQHYWSPQLDLEISEEDIGCKIKGLFGPRPSVWFMFVFFYSVLGFVSVMVMIMGLSLSNISSGGASAPL